MAQFTLYSRSYCHLCDDMFAALMALAPPPEAPFAVAVIDVDAAAEAGDAGPLQRFDERVPVLFGAPDGPELCHYFLDEPAVRHWLATQQAAGSA